MKFFCASSVVSILLLAPICGAQEIPKAADPRLVVELVAASPDIVHPISCDFDAKGRLLVIESHTHFAPKDYKGPKFDRIRMFDVSKPGAKPTTFFEGTRHTMDLAVHPDGSVYLATRNEILRLRDTKGTGVADEKTRIVFLDTKGDYPHNGLSGLCFDSKGDLTFGMGENLGAKYTLIGSDGAKFSGEGDGGHIFHCSADGKKLRRIATGFWNPFGNCRDIYGRLFCVDNDPDQAPPCRMLHVVEGGDYGFTFRYGRSGKHPFQSWHGTLPGTLPMMTGVGEAPCEILSYESDGLPAEYRGQLLVTSWADHRVERYAVKPHGASFKGERLPFIQGGKDFRPVGLCTAPDGSLYVTDWVLSNYNLHGKGAIWRIRMKDAPKVDRPADPKKAILSMHRPLREAAAKTLAFEHRRYGDPKTLEFLKDCLTHENVRVRVAALTAVIAWDRPWNLDLVSIVETDKELGLRQLAVNYLQSGRPYLDSRYPALLRADAAKFLTARAHVPKLLELLEDDDPFLRHAAVRQVILHNGIRLELKAQKDRLSLRQRTALMQGQRTLDGEVNFGIIQPFLEDPDETVRFLAVKWVADEKLADYRKHIEKGMHSPNLSVRMYTAYATALARLDGKNIDEKGLADYFAKRLDDDTTPPALRALLLRQVPTTHPKLTIALLGKLLTSDDTALKFEAVRAIVEHSSPKREDVLVGLLRDAKQSELLRTWALVGLAEGARRHRGDVLDLALNGKPSLRDEALRALIGVPMTVPDNEDLNLLRLKKPESAPLAARVIGMPFFKDRPPAKDLDAWLKRLEGKADAEAGARIFFHPKLAGCYKCHRIDGRGQDVGPHLSGIGNIDRRRLLESILQPSNTVAPHYVAWHLETADGKVRNGMLLHTNLDEYTYLDAKGEKFKVRTNDLVEHRPLTTSIMPDGLQDRMTDQEMRDLLAYLQTRK